MQSHRVLVTTAAMGGEVICRVAAANGHRPIGVDHAFDGDLKIPKAGDHSLPQWLEAWKPDVVIPGMIEEMWAVEKAGLPSVPFNMRAVEICRSKTKMAVQFDKHQVPSPKWGQDAWDAKRIVIKPDDGRGSRDVFYCRSLTAATAAIDLIGPANGGPFIQAHAEGVEFNTEGFANDEHELVCMVAYERRRTLGGLTIEGVSRFHPNIADAAGRAVKACRVIGPHNVQGFITPAGKVTITEVNPRMSPSIAMAERCGIPVFAHSIDVATGADMPKPPAGGVVWPDGVRYRRTVVENWDTVDA